MPSPKVTKRQYPAQPQPVHHDAVWQQSLLQPRHQTAEQLPQAQRLITASRSIDIQTHINKTECDYLEILLDSISTQENILTLLHICSLGIWYQKCVTFVIERGLNYISSFIFHIKG